MTRSKPMPLSVLSLAAAALLAPPALAQEAAAVLTAERIAACTEDRRAEGCATVLTRVMVCAQAPAIAGCEAINAAAEEAANPVETAEPEVEPRAEGELDGEDEESDVEDDAD